MFHKYLLAVLVSLSAIGSSWTRSTQWPVCDTEEFRCHESTGQYCIPDYWVCDHLPDCDHGEDEHSCQNAPRCFEGEVMCANNRECVPEDWLCDGERDCEDASDEDQSRCPNLARSSEEKEEPEVTESERHYGHHGNGHHGNTAFRHSRRHSNHQ